MSEAETTGLATRTTMVRARRSAESAQDAIAILSSAAIEAGLATDEFATAILEREQDYPTGLPTIVPVAIPHIHDGCLRSFLSCMTLTSPVEFSSMDGDEEPLQVEIVFCFGITEPKQQAAVLRRLSVLFQNAGHLQRLRDATTDGALLDTLAELLDDGLTIID